MSRVSVSLAGLVIVFICWACGPRFGEVAGPAQTWFWVGQNQERELVVIETSDLSRCLNSAGKSRILAKWNPQKSALVPLDLEAPCGVLEPLSVTEVIDRLSLSVDSYSWGKPLAAGKPDSGVFLGRGLRSIWVGAKDTSIQVIVGYYGNREGSEIRHTYRSTIEDGTVRLVTEENQSRSVLLEPMPNF